MENCSAEYYDYGGTGDSKFGEPLPWIGLYVAAASLACLLLMTFDLFTNSKPSTPWIASKFFSFNATTITLLAVVTKISSDITGAMPGLVDQLTKLSGVILLCVAMNHAMPSLGAMDGLAASSNMIALGIMVISVFVNIWIQLNSGVIFNYYFRYMYIYYSLNMLLLFLILVFHTLSVFPSRRILSQKYYKIHEEILNEISRVDASVQFSYCNLCEYVTRYWLMAITSSPIYTLKTSAEAIASSCLNAYPFAVIFVYGIVFISGKLERGNKLRCFVRSDYSWSTWLIFFIQVLTIAVGCATSIQRIQRSKIHTQQSCPYSIENYKIKLMMDWNDIPLPVWISNMRIRKAMYYSRGMFLIALTFMHRLVIVISTIIFVIHDYLVVITCTCVLPATLILLKILEQSVNFTAIGFRPRDHQENL